MFVVLKAIPYTPNGKVDRKALPKPSWDREISGTANDLDSPATILGAMGEQKSNRLEHETRSDRPRTATEKQLAEIWAKLLGLTEIGVNDSFIELGGYSLLAIQMNFQIRKEFGIEISLVEFLTDGLTISGLANQIEEALIKQADPHEIEEFLRTLSTLSESEVDGLIHEE
jgi:acyl carrier protein